MILLIQFCCFILFYTNVQADLDYDGKAQILLEHAIDSSAAYKFRGELNIRSLHSGQYFLEQAQLSQKELFQLTDNARHGGVYRLRATVTSAVGKKTVFDTFTSACALLQSNLNDILYVNLDHIGNVVGVSLSTETGCTEDVASKDLQNFSTSVYVRHMELGPVPDTASYIQKLEREREAKDRGEVKDNRSFLAKYWMYIVPVGIFILISSANNPEGGGAQ